jgi:hypothetical protein
MSGGLDPELERRAMEYLTLVPELAGAAANLRLAVVHDLGPAQGEAIRLAVAEVDAALHRMEMIDPAGFAAVVPNEQEAVDVLRRRMGLPPEEAPGE